MSSRIDSDTVADAVETRELRAGPAGCVPDSSLSDYLSLLHADRKLFEVLDMLSRCDSLPECVLLDVVRYSIASRLEALQSAVYGRLEERRTHRLWQPTANLKPV